MSAPTNREIVEKLWIDLYNRDFDAVGAAFADDGEYTDMPTVRSIVREAAKNDNRMSSFILGVVNSVPFRMSKPEPANKLLATEAGSK